MKKMLLNISLFEIGWLVCVLGGNTYAIAYTLVALVLHYRLVMNNPLEWKLLAAVVAVGCLWDWTMVMVGVIHYGEAGSFGIPIWLVCLWLLFATTFMHCLLWLRRYLRLVPVVAAVLGPATYWAGTALTDAELAAPLYQSLGVMALGWAVLFPFAVIYAGKLDNEYASKQQDDRAQARSAAV